MSRPQVHFERDGELGVVSPEFRTRRFLGHRMLMLGVRQG